MNTNRPVTNTLRPLKVPLKRRLVEGHHSLSREQRATVATRYLAGESMRSLAYEFDVWCDTIRDAITENGGALRTSSARNRIFPLNEAVFDEPTEEGRYWIGFLMADGCVMKTKKNCWRISLGVAEQDAEHLIRFRDFLATKAPIKWRRAGFSGGMHHAPYAHISLYSERLASALGRFGVLPRKTGQELVVGLEYCRHFWRGAVDGDGWVTRHKLTSGDVPLIGFTSGLRIVQQFQEFALTVAPGSAATIRPNGSVYKFSLTGRYAIPLIRHLYDDAKVSLPRKRNAGQQAISGYEARAVEQRFAGRAR